MLSDVLPGLRELGHHVSVATFWEPQDLGPELERRGVRVRSLGLVSAQRWVLPTIASALRRLVEEERPDVLHAHLFFPVFYAGLLSRLPGRPARVGTFHNMDYDIYPAHGTIKRLRRRLHGLAVARLDARVAVSHAVRQHLEAELGASDIRVIPNAVATDRLVRAHLDPTRVREDLGIPAEGILVALPGRLVQQKGHVFAIEALAKLRARGLDLRLALAGGGPLQEELERAALLAGVRGFVHFLGVLPHEALMGLLEAASVVVMPSLAEGFGIVAVEAMSLSCPLVASDIGPLREIIDPERTGILVPPGDAAALAAALERLVSSPARQAELGAAAREAVVTRYSPRGVATALDELYRSLRSGAEASRPPA